MSAPPGYTDTSLLSGGESPILRVMGGGGSEDVSLLQGGVADIARVMGGGGTEDVSLLDGGENSKIIEMVGGVTFGPDEVKEIPALSKKEKTATQKYVKEVTKAATYSTEDRVNIRTPEQEADAAKHVVNTLAKLKKGATAPTIPTVPIAPTVAPTASTIAVPAKKSFQAELYKPSPMSQEDTDEMNNFVRDFKVDGKELIALEEGFKKQYTEKWTRLDISGKEQGVETYHSLIQVIPETIDTLIVIPPVRDNFSTFLRLLDYLYENEIISENEVIRKNTALVFMAPNFKNDTTIFSFLHLQSKNRDSVFALHEAGAPEPLDLLPSYLVFPHAVGAYDGLILGGKMPAMKNAKAMMPTSEVLTKKSAFAINANTSTEDKGFSKYLVISEGANTISKMVQIPKCQDLQTFVGDADVKSPLHISEEILVLRFGIKSDTPLLCGGILPKSESGFEGSVVSTGPFIEVYIDGVKRVFRVPTADNKVFDNWAHGIFTKEEADFLNSLNITPFILGLLFNDTESWKMKLANFLKNLVESRCFDDATILAKGECQDTRSFLNSVYNYFFIHAAIDEEKPDVFDLEFHRPSDQEMREIVWPEDLEEIAEGAFEKERYGIIEENIDILNNLHVHNFIVVHKKTGASKFMRAKINSIEMAKVIEADKEAKRAKITQELAGASPEVIEVELEKMKLGPLKIIADIIEDIKDKYTEFAFIY
jgi:hypothetical protein